VLFHGFKKNYAKASFGAEVLAGVFSGESLSAVIASLSDCSQQQPETSKRLGFIVSDFSSAEASFFWSIGFAFVGCVVANAGATQTVAKANDKNSFLIMFLPFLYSKMCTNCAKETLKSLP
jgi:hypothetical protein